MPEQSNPATPDPEWKAEKFHPTGPLLQEDTSRNSTPAAWLLWEGHVRLEPVLPVQKWPGVESSYQYADENGQTVLKVSLQLEPETAPGQLPIYQQLYFQLVQDAGQAGFGHLTGPAVQLTLMHGLLEETFPFNQAEHQTLLNFVADIMLFLQGETSTPPFATLTFETVVERLPSHRSLFRLEVALWMNVQPVLAAGIPWLVRSDLSPALPLKAFAREAEALFQTEEWALKMGQDELEGTLWAVRLARTDKGQEVKFKILPDPTFHACKPLSLALQNFTVQVEHFDPTRPYGSGPSEPFKMHQVDLNVWFPQVLKTLEDLSDRAGEARAVLGEDPLYQDLLEVLNKKRALKDLLSSTLVEVFEGPEHPEAKQTARHFLLETLQDEPSRRAALASVGVFSVEVGGFENNPAHITGFSGHLEHLPSQNPDETSNVLLSLKPGGQSATLAVGFRLSQDVQPAFVVLKEARCVLTHLKHANPEGAPGNILLLAGPWLLDLPEENAVPFPLLKLPAPTLLIQQDFCSVAAPSPRDLKTWTYLCSFRPTQPSHPHRVRVRRSAKTAGASPSAPLSTPSSALPEALARFLQVAPGISHSLPLNSLPDFVASRFHVQALEVLTDAVLRACQSWTTSAAPALVSSAAPVEDLVFDLHLHAVPDGDPQGEAQIRLLPIRGDFTFGTPEVLLSPETHRPEKLGKGADLHLHYLDETGKALTFQEALALKEWTLRLQDLDAFEVQHLQSAVQLKVNRALHPDPQVQTRAAFLLEVAESSFLTPVMPHLEWVEYSLTPETENTSLATCLETFFRALLTPLEGTGQPGFLHLSLDCRFQSVILPEQPDTTTDTPVFLLPAVELSREGLPALMKQVSDHLHLWHQMTLPADLRSSSLVFHVRISGDEKTLPLVEVQNLRVPARVLEVAPG